MSGMENRLCLGVGTSQRVKGEVVCGDEHGWSDRNRTLKPVEIVLRRWEGGEFDQDRSYAYVKISQWNYFVQLIYANKNGKKFSWGFRIDNAYQKKWK
jgi:hypothetical protein